MTIHYPDVSHYLTGLKIQAGTVAVCAKASEGSTVHDPDFSEFRKQAAARKAYFFGYHFLHHGDIAAQAASCHKVVGKVPVMIDCEDTGSRPTVGDCVDFAKALRKLGGVCTLVYLPHWYWQDHLSGPSLTPFKDADLSLVSSQYRAYSDSGAGWDAYGGLKPVIWQYSDTTSYGGKKVDFNAYRGTKAELTALVSGKPTAPPTPILPEDDDVTHLDLELNLPKVITSPTLAGGTGLLTLSSDFGDATVRVALKHAGGGWTVHDKVAVTAAGDPVTVSKIDKTITKISALVETLSDPTRTVVGLDLFPDRSYS